jgi:hypothetical protein
MNSHAAFKVTCLAVAAGVVSVAALLLLETGAQQQEDRGRSRSVQTMVDDCKLLVLEPEARAGGQSRRLGRDGGAPVPKQDDKRAAARPRRLVMNSIRTRSMADDNFNREAGRKVTTLDGQVEIGIGSG